MDTKTFLDELLKTGREYAEKGQAIVKEQLNVDETNDQKDATLDGIKKGALAAGALALMLGTKSGRKLSGAALKVGSLAALGGIAFKAWQKTQARQTAGESAEDAAPVAVERLSVDKLEGEAANERAMILIKAMIAVAKADGKIDDDEKDIINREIKRLGLHTKLEDVMRAGSVTPLSAKAVANMADSEEVAAEIYLVSIMVADHENIQESGYINELAAALDLPQDLVAELNTFRH